MAFADAEVEARAPKLAVKFKALTGRRESQREQRLLVIGTMLLPSPPASQAD